MNNNNKETKSMFELMNDYMDDFSETFEEPFNALEKDNSMEVFEVVEVEVIEEEVILETSENYLPNEVVTYTETIDTFEVIDYTEQLKAIDVHLESINLYLGNINFICLIVFTLVVFNFVWDRLKIKKVRGGDF